MKRKYFSILLAAMTIAASANVYAAPSIGQIIPEAPKVVEGNLSNNQQLIVKDVDTGAYKDKKVAEVVTKVNDDNTKVNMNEILKDLKVDTTETIKTNTEIWLLRKMIRSHMKQMVLLKQPLPSKRPRM